MSEDLYLEKKTEQLMALKYARAIVTNAGLKEEKKYLSKKKKYIMCNNKSICTINV